MTDDTRWRVAEAARISYGRLVALLARRAGDIARAEDDIGEAFRRALERWPVDGVPDNPDGWLLTVARNLQRDRARSAAERLSQPLPETVVEIMDLERDPDAIPDERLRLMFACAHPAIDATIRTPLILQTVLGLEARDIAAAFMMSADAMAQRLVRAKQKIKLARIPFVVPERSDMAERLEAVLEAIYGAYAVHWIDGAELAGSERDLGAEALFLSSLMASLLPAEPEALGLSALVTFVEARRQARTAAGGAFIPLDQQDTVLWNRTMIARANGLLVTAQKRGRLGRFQLEAAIQAAHAERLYTGRVQWKAVMQLYEALLRFAPTAGALVGLAGSLGQAGHAAAGLSLLAGNAQMIGTSFQPFWAVKADLLARNGDRAGAYDAYNHAIDLSSNAAVRAYLRDRRAALSAD